MNKRNWLSAAAAIGVMMMATTAQAQVAGTVGAVPLVPSSTTLTVVAEGRSLRTPDIAEVSGGVVTTALTAAAAMRENAVRMNAVVAAVKKAGIADRDVQTSGLSLQPQYKYENNQAPVLTGYQATNTVALRIRKIADTGKLLDTLVGVGANQISGPNFRVEAEEAALDEARVAAMGTARARAELYAKAAGLRVKRIASIAEAGGFEPRPQPMMVRQAKMADAMASPVAPGEVALSVNVTVVFELE
ncbi:SIMPL domain-containing protein [Polymorphobacter glacialis]|uniref:SIMPL domain-containing protein n=1 Tax=Sandarakinorhabdus glacialis TaxID=1614636 RepID=A0A917E497_9SPHN|nr:SIMPL domain-containing protein [Polymorphobacter glacialis]GGE00067.1 SIMPL domain-containing protein [Polymorphobacter glacialis]